MLFDFDKDDFPAGRRFEVCIVGAGAAGLVLAHELTRRGHDVLLVEGGGESRWERRSQALNRSYIRGNKFAGAHSGRFRALGGSTSAWAGQIMEFDELDFSPREWVEGSGWPIRKSDLQPYYRRAMEIEGVAGQLQEDEAVWASVGLEPPPLGEDLHMSFSRYTPEKKFARLFSEMIRGPRLTVVLHANLVTMLPSEDERSIAELRFRSLKGKEASLNAKYVILCLGGIETSRLLLNQAFCPWNASGFVGRHFQDHIQCFAGDLKGADLSQPNWPFGPYRLAEKYLPKVKLTAEAQRKYEVLNVNGMIEFQDGVYPTLRTGIKVLGGPAAAVGIGEFLQMAPRAPGAIWHHFQIKKDPNYALPWARPKLSVYCEQSPKSESRITLSNKRDKLGLRRANIDWQISEQELQTIRVYAKVAQEAFARSGAGEVVLDPDLFTDRIVEKCTDQFHHCGGARMAENARDGVVDADLRLHGIENAFLCSSAVFPSSGFTNPTHTIIALAVRLSDHLDSALTSGAGR
ncbi:GMC family oxidoreductase [Phenylobacterium sp.]|jgi:choline dehydrogenase-like flavoprotein|uniref:GMC family oxidoreductase n=1 Tax=Phenylobacterium sp. TaxID=1871053 RepID=UPI002F3E40EA